jgi:hypothetical protein
MTQPDDIGAQEVFDEDIEDENFELTEDLFVAPKIRPTTCGLCHSAIDGDGRRTGDPRGRDRHTCSMCCW